MKLKDFIKETITQIVDGVVEAQAAIGHHGAEINPKKVQFKEAGQLNHYNSGKPQMVEFDVGLTSIQKTGSAEGVGVFLGAISLGKKTTKEPSKLRLAELSSVSQSFFQVGKASTWNSAPNASLQTERKPNLCLQGTSLSVGP